MTRRTWFERLPGWLQSPLQWLQDYDDRLAAQQKEYTDELRYLLRRWRRGR